MAATGRKRRRPGRSWPRFSYRPTASTPSGPPRTSTPFSANSPRKACSPPEMRRVDLPTLRAAWWAQRALRRARRTLRRDGLAHAAVTDPPALEDHASRGVHAVLRRKPSTCLERALVLQRWHAAQGIEQDVIIAVKGPADNFAAHAWVDGEPRPGRVVRRTAAAPGADDRASALRAHSARGGLGAGLRAHTDAPDADGGRSPTRSRRSSGSSLPRSSGRPCVVSFSGGRDSSAVLAAAVRVARREGLPLPIPSTNRFPAAKDSHESDWQERVVAHLGLDDWLKPEFTDELDCVGPVATSVLRRHGLLWPFNAHFHVPQLEAAAGGSLLTGIGGDETLSASSWARAQAVLSGRAKPERPRHPARRLPRCSSTGSSGRAAQTRTAGEYSWLRPPARRAVSQRAAPRKERPSRSAGKRSSAGGCVSATSTWASRAWICWPPMPPSGSCTPSPTQDSRLRLPVSRSRADTPTARLRCVSCSAISFPTTCSPARPSPASTRPSGATGAARSPRTGSGAGADPELVDVEALQQEWSLARARSPLLHAAASRMDRPQNGRIWELCELVRWPVPLRCDASYRLSSLRGIMPMSNSPTTTSS